MKVFGVVGWSGSGKTTFIEQLLPFFASRGLRVSVVKHCHHPVGPEGPGKDSQRHRDAGAAQVLLASGPSLEPALERLSACDLVIVEGFKTEPIPKLEVWRPDPGGPLLHPSDPAIIAVVSDARVATDLPVFRPDEAQAVGTFVLGRLGL
ncbi:MAG: molybdopterin-guanine dinucleotide biosynthesis protein B [Elusimicrobiota bacterium]